ncbi:16S rRNA (adenine(1518)-N(6)/adenine(1519)-N(6))-dimethyltransferase RsmA [Maricaulaceae bacterium MS644]
MSIDALPPLRDVIASHGLAADKRFGQHYLLDLNVTAKIARLCGDLSETSVFEVGPGPGGLTRALLAQGAGEVIAIEKDARFLPALEEIRAASQDRLSLVEADALKVDERSIETRFKTRMLASNLPYNVGTALLIKWLEAKPVWWSRLVLMFQKEVAERVVARAGDDAYGRLAILTAAVASARYAFTLPARAFTPPPKVDSAVVVLEPLPEAEKFADLIALSAVTESAFGQRRKTLRKSLGVAAGKCGVKSEALLDTAGIDGGARAETIPPEGFFRLATAWRAARGPG